MVWVRVRVTFAVLTSAVLTFAVAHIRRSLSMPTDSLPNINPLHPICTDSLSNINSLYPICTDSLPNINPLYPICTDSLRGINPLYPICTDSLPDAGHSHDYTRNLPDSSTLLLDCLGKTKRSAFISH